MHVYTREGKMYRWSFSCRKTRMSVIRRTCTSMTKHTQVTNMFNQPATILAVGMTVVQLLQYYPM